MLPVEGILEEFHNIVSYGVFCSKTSNNRTIVNSGL